MNKNLKNKGLSKQLLNKAYEKKWFKLFVNKDFNGLQLSLPEGLEIIRKACQLNGSLGWCVNLGAGANYFSGFFSNEGAKKIFTDNKCVLAGSGGLASEVEKIDGGYLISGKWGKATGALHASHFTCNGVLPTGETVSFAISKDQIQLINDWKLLGMKKSSSMGFSAQKAFVPVEFVFKINQPQLASSYKIHFLPFNSFAQFCMTAAIIGLAEGIIQKLSISELKDVAQKSHKDLEDFCIESALNMNKIAQKVWGTIQEYECDIHEKEIEFLVKNTGFTLYQKVNQLYFDAGLIMANENHPVQESYIDFMLAIQHFIFKPQLND
jgi:hypothetical protein